MNDSSFLVRLSKEQHELFKRALALRGGSMSGTTRKLVVEWSSKVIAESGIVYGFKRGDNYVSFFKVNKRGEVSNIEFGNPIALQLTDAITREYLEKLAKKMDCKLVRLD